MSKKKPSECTGNRNDDYHVSKNPEQHVKLADRRIMAIECPNFPDKYCLPNGIHILSGNLVDLKGKVIKTKAQLEADAKIAAAKAAREAKESEGTKD